MKTPSTTIAASFLLIAAIVTMTAGVWAQSPDSPLKMGGRGSRRAANHRLSRETGSAGASPSQRLVVFQQPSKPGSPPPANALSKEEDQAVRTTIEGIEKSWNAHDMEAMSRLFTEDAEFINVVGMHWRGRDDIMTAHAAFHKTSFKNHHLKTDSIQTRSLGSGLAIAVVTTTNDSFTTPTGQVVPKRQNRQTYVLTKGSEGWKIAHGHNVAVDAEAEKHDPVKRSGQ